MSRYHTLAAALAALYLVQPDIGGRYRKARVQRFLYRHRAKHQAIIGALEKAERRRVRRRAKLRHAKQLEWERAPSGRGALKRRIRA